AALRSAAADADAGRLTPSQFDAVAAALNDTYNDHIDQQQSDYHTLLAGPVAEGYVVRFAAAYVMIAGDGSYRREKPYDAAAMDQAVRDEQDAATECRGRNGDTTEAVSLECYITAYRHFAETIKLRDMGMFDAFASAMRQAAADTDAHRLTRWQESAVY